MTTRAGKGKGAGQQVGLGELGRQGVQSEVVGMCDFGGIGGKGVDSGLGVGVGAIIGHDDMGGVR